MSHEVVARAVRTFRSESFLAALTASSVRSSIVELRDVSSARDRLSAIRIFSRLHGKRSVCGIRLAQNGFEILFLQKQKFAGHNANA